MAVNLPSKLNPLVDFLSNLNERAPMQQLDTLLRELDITLEELATFAKFGDKTYARNLICEGEWFELLCICWKSGQRSPIHNHAGSTCGLRILQGVCTETKFEETPSGQIKAVSSHDCGKDTVCVSQDSDVHQISNLQKEGDDLMTLHIYSPPLRQMDRFSLYSQERELYVPQNQVNICHVADFI